MSTKKTSGGIEAGLSRAAANRFTSQDEAESALGMNEVEPQQAVPDAPSPAPQGDPMDAVQPSVTPVPTLSEMSPAEEPLQANPQPQPQQEAPQQDGWTEISMGGESYSVRDVPTVQGEPSQQHGVPMGIGMDQSIPMEGAPQQQPGPRMIPSASGRGTTVLPPERSGGRPSEMFVEGVGRVSTLPGRTNGRILEAVPGSGYRQGDLYGAPGGADPEKGMTTEVDEDGNVRHVPIEGGSVQIKEKEKQAIQSVFNGTVLKDSRRALDMLDSATGKGGISGWWDRKKTTSSITAGVASKVPGTDARKFENIIKSMKAPLGFDTLMKIKASGAGLGHVPQSQLETLQDAFARIDTMDDRDALRYNIRRIESLTWWMANPVDFMAHANESDFYHAGKTREELEVELESAKRRGIPLGLGLSFSRDVENAPPPDPTDPRNSGNVGGVKTLPPGSMFEKANPYLP